MKKLIEIIVTGTNNVFRRDGCPLDCNNPEYKEYMASQTKGHYIVITALTYNGLPEKNPPYKDCEVFIISDKDIILEEEATNTSVVPCLQEALSLVNDEMRKVFVVVDEALHNEITEMLSDTVDQHLVVRLNKKVKGTGYYEPPLQFNSSPPIIVLGVPQKGKRKPPLTVTKYNIDVHHF